MLVNPWTVELSRASRLAGLAQFRRAYAACSIRTTLVLVDGDDERNEGLFATERTFRCTNRETGRRGADRDLAFGEVAFAPEPRLRYCRVYFDPKAGGSQEPSKSTGAVHGWDLAHVITPPHEAITGRIP